MARRSDTRRRLTVAQAADALDVTVDAVRSRIKRKTIDHVREGGRVYIMLGDDQVNTRQDQGDAQGSAQHTDQSTGQPPETGRDPRDELLEEQRDQIAFLRRELEAERNAHAETRRIAYTLAQRVPELEAAQEPPQAPESAGEPRSDTNTPAPENEPQRRSWWRRIFGE